MGNGGGLFWNEETQRWDDGTAAVAPATPPPPGRPGHAPVPSGGITDPDAPTSTAVPRPPGPPPDPAPYSTRPPAGPPSVPPAPPTLPVPPAPSAGPGGYGRRTVWTVLGASAAAGVAVALVLSLGLGGKENDGRQGVVTASGTPSSTEPSPTPPTSPEPSAGIPSLPAGYVAYDDPQGFRIALPDGWQRQRSTVSSQYGMDVVNYRDSTGHYRLQVFEVRESSPDASFDLFLSDAVPKPPGFQVLSRMNLDSGDFTGSRLEYLANSLRGEPEIGTWHVVDQRFQAADGKIYAIASYGPDVDGRSDEHTVLTTAVDWFCPPSTSCPS
ncbi:hypothetical protein [Streptomyces thermoalcalitolerans]|uniref:Uncharacterized protein n=1 Tax=Streptomyces thermoalcalitolerans TaxID=65605 RepID=A0ABP3Z647_9ACTN